MCRAVRGGGSTSVKRGATSASVSDTIVCDRIANASEKVEEPLFGVLGSSPYQPPIKGGTPPVRGNLRYHIVNLQHMYIRRPIGVWGSKFDSVGFEKQSQAKAKAESEAKRKRSEVKRERKRKRSERRSIALRSD